MFPTGKEGGGRGGPAPEASGRPSGVPGLDGRHARQAGCLCRGERRPPGTPEQAR